MLFSFCKTLIITGEDRYGRYADILTKLYLADAFHHNHQIYFVNLDDDPKKIVSGKNLFLNSFR